MSLPSNSGRRITRSGKPLDKPANEPKEVFTTPMKDCEKTPTSSTAIKSNSNTASSEKATICSICQSSIKLRNNYFANSVGTLVGKINTAYETFSDSMAQVENLGLNIRHFLISNGDQALTLDNTLTKISQEIAVFEEKWNSISNSMNTNNNHLKLMSENIADFKNDREKLLSSHIEKIKQRISAIDKLLKDTTAASNVADYMPDCAEMSNQYAPSTDNCNNIFTLGSSDERIIHSIPKLTSNPILKFDGFEESILPIDLRSSICQFLEGNSAFTDKGSHKAAYFGYDFNKSKNIIPKPILEAIQLIHEKYSTTDSCEINSVHVKKFLGKSSHLEQQSDFSPYLSSESDIYNILLGNSSTITFTYKCANEESVLNVCDNSIYKTSVKSQHYWSYGVDRPNSSEGSVTYILSFLSIHRSHQKSTVIVGDSNTHNISFHNNNQKQRSDLGKDIYGKKVKAFIIDQIDPHEAIGYKNIAVQVGVNNLKRKYTNEYGIVDIDSAFDARLRKIICIKQLCPTSRIIISPVMPTKIRDINDRAKQFNHRIFSCVNKFWNSLGFDSFLGNDGLLDDNMGRYFNASIGRRDRIHLGRLGISRLSLMIRKAVLYPRQVMEPIV